jgi:hypothetical protein
MILSIGLNLQNLALALFCNGELFLGESDLGRTKYPVKQAQIAREVTDEFANGNATTNVMIKWQARGNGV